MTITTTVTAGARKRLEGGLNPSRGHPRRMVPVVLRPPQTHAKAVAQVGAAMDGMVWIPGATFVMGSDRHYPEEGPAHKVTVDGFWIDACPG